MNTLISKDGTKIVYDKNGSGPAVILVDGAFCSRNFGPMPKLIPLLSKQFTVYTYDRRARGESGDTKPYTVEKEVEDIEALINVAGGTAYLFGISSGAVLSIKAAASKLNIKKLVLFEPPYNTESRKHRPPADSTKQLQQLIDGSRKKDAVKFYLQQVIKVPAIVPFILRLTPNWSKMIANASSLPYDAAVMGDFFMHKEEIKSITISTLVIASQKSPESLRRPVMEVAESLPMGKHTILKGQIHNIPPKILVPVLIEFFNQ